MNNYSRLSGASALSARTARACESCLKRRARWFCPADDAFLCHPCDSSVHSANELAGRHTRVRLSSSSTSTSSSNLTHNNPITHPAWHRGFTRKARTPRRWNKKNQNDCGTPTATTLVVPQMESEVIHPESGGCFDDGRYYSIINGLEEKDHHELGFSVPVLDEDPFEREVRGGSVDQHEFDFSMVDFVGSEDHQDPSWDILPGFDLACLEGDDVAATVELEKLVVKAEDESGKEEEVVDYWDMEIFGSSIVKQEEKKKGDAVVMEKDDEYGSGRGGEGWLSNDNNNKKRRKLMMLQLNYDEVIQAWNTQGCPAWSAGHVDLPTIDAWSTSSSYATTWQGGGGLAKEMGHGAHHQQQGNCCRHQGSNEDDADGGRGARVMRYREKRKNRLFAKKIRYQVRKLNAEKRPRLKGRFVKRTPGSAIPNPTMAFTRRHSSFPSPPTGATGLGPGIGVGVGQTHH